MINGDILALSIQGIVLGSTLGISPGPLTVFVAKKFIENEVKKGIIASLTPLLTDLPICIILILTLSKVATSNKILALIGLIGSIYIFYIGLKDLKNKNQTIKEESKEKIVIKAAFLNLLNPNPYIFWSTVGVPLIIGSNLGLRFSLPAFFLSFILSMALAKILMGISLKFFVWKSQKILKWSSLISGILMWVFAGFIFFQSINLWRQS